MRIPVVPFVVVVGPVRLLAGVMRFLRRLLDRRLRPLRLGPMRRGQPVAILALAAAALIAKWGEFQTFASDLFQKLMGR